MSHIASSPTNSDLEELEALKLFNYLNLFQLRSFLSYRAAHRCAKKVYLTSSLQFVKYLWVPIRMCFSLTILESVFSALSQFATSRLALNPVVCMYAIC